MVNRLKPFLGQRISFKFLVATSLTITVIFVVVFVWFSRQQEDHIMEQVKKQAIILHKQIVSYPPVGGGSQRRARSEDRGG